MYTSFQTAQHLVDYIPSESTVFVVARVAPGASVQAVVDSLRQRLKGNDVYTKQEFSTKTRRYWAIETGVGFSFLLTIVISFLVGILIVGQTIYNSTMEHIKEFGTLKAMGAGNGDIYRIILSQALINALLGYVVSLAVTIVTVGLYDALGMVLVVRWWINLLVLLLTVSMCIVAALISIRRIKRIDPAILFRG
jgi:putative ABC transport system permease protein